MIADMFSFPAIIVTIPMLLFILFNVVMFFVPRAKREEWAARVEAWGRKQEEK